MTEDNEENVEHIWKNVQTTILDVAKKCLEMCLNAKKKYWFNANCKKIIDRKNKLREILKQPTNENIEQHSASRNNS